MQDWCFADEISEQLHLTPTIKVSLPDCSVFSVTTCLLQRPTSQVKRILAHLLPVVSPTLDPLQCAYRPNIGVEDA
ncbi:unnamed protein product [Knipowitschia caucasica]|uniref:Uncharacterized protein n=1 Tax=Knipowitschia caucasica TaxID=637954 RepID=A0AAV2KZI5_KNICA